MKIAPIIHTRTYNCDFNSEFLIRPDTFTHSDIIWARKNVLSATAKIDLLKGVRWMTADNEKYRIGGVVGFLKDICSESAQSEDDMKKHEKLFCDNKGRQVFAFIGVVVDKLNNKDYGKLTYNYLWNMYAEKLSPIWERSYSEVITEKFSDVYFDPYIGLSVPRSDNIGTMELYEADPVTDYNIFLDLFCNAEKNNFSFCSNITDYTTVKQSGYSAITTSYNTISRLKKESSTAVNQADENGTISEYNNADTSGNKNDKKKGLTILIIGLLILLIIILMLLLAAKIRSE